MTDIRINRGAAQLGLGVLAAVALVVTLVALVAEGSFTTVSYVALGVMILSAAGAILLDPEGIAARLTGRTGQYAVTTILLSIVVVAVVIGLFALVRAAQITPIDATDAGRFRLSEETREIIAEIEEPVEAIAFYSIQDTDGRTETELWLQAYENASDGLISYRFVDPERNPGEAAALGVEQSGVVVFSQGDRTDNVTFVDERNLTTALLRVIIGEVRKVYSLSGHGERDIFGFTGENYSNIRQSLERVGFEFDTLNLLEVEGGVPEDADLVMVLGPVAQFSQPEIDALQAYMDGGGSLLVLSEPPVGNQGTLGSGVLSVDFAPGGESFVTAGTDGTARIFSVEDVSQDLVLRGHAGDVLDAAYSPDGSQIATMSRDGTVRIWEADSGEQITALEGHQAGAGRLAFSPDGGLLASAAEDNVLRVWQTSDYSELGYSPLAVPLQLYSVEFSPDGETIAAVGGRGSSSGAVEGILYLWNAADGSEITNARLHGNVAFSLAFSPDGSAVHTAALDGSEGIFDLEALEGSTVNPYDTGILSLDFTPDGGRVYTLVDGTVHVRPAGSTDAEDDTLLEGHTDIVWDTDLNEDGTLVTVSADGDVRLWDFEAGEQSELLVAPHAASNLLENYLSGAWGITLNDDLVIDIATQNITGDLVTPVLRNLNQHPITTPLIEAGAPPYMFTARSISEVQPAPEQTNINTLAQTTAGGQSWGETTDPFATGGGVEFNPGEDINGPVTVGVAAESTDTGARLVVFSDADLASNDLLQDRTFGNAELFTNAVNWLTESDELINLPSPEFDQSTIDRPLTGAAFAVTGITLVCLLPAAMIIGGVVVLVTRRRRR